MNFRIDRKNVPALTLFAAGVLMLVFAMSSSRSLGDTAEAADDVQRILSHRMEQLEKYVSLPPRELPADMVIYRYSGDSLKSWSNQFDVTNDDIRPRVVFQRLTDMRSSPGFPLASIGDSLSYYCFGSSWYLAKAVHLSEKECALVGLMVVDTRISGSLNGVNLKLRLGDKFSIKPLEYSGGTAVYVEGRPQFKVLYDSLSGTSAYNAILVWLAFAFIVASILSYVLLERTLSRYVISVVVAFVAVAAMYVWGLEVQTDFPVFSPTLFSGGRLLFSLGAVILANFLIVFMTGGLFLVRSDILPRITSRRHAIFATALMAVTALFVAAYIHRTLESIIFNSGITLELYKFKQLTVWTAVVYASFVSVLAMLPLVVQMSVSLFTGLSGNGYSVLSARGRILWACAIAFYLVLTTGIMGMVKEQNRTELWANRLAVDRDISLELQLKRVESRIASDPIMASYSAFDNSASLIHNRLVDNYFPRLTQNYDLSVYVLPPGLEDKRQKEFFDSRLKGGQPVSDGSHFLYSEIGNGHSRYDGLFSYYISNYGVVQLIVEIEPKLTSSPRGYSQLLDITPPGAVSVPALYSYAHYKGNVMPLYRGSYAYPVVMDDQFRAFLEKNAGGRYNDNGYTHFVFNVAEGEYVLISRPQDRYLGYAVSFVLLVFLALAILSILTLGRPRERWHFENRYFRTWISGTLTSSLLLVMVVLAIVSVTFVNRSNDNNLNRIISEKATSIQSMVMSGLRGASTTRDLTMPEAVSVLKSISGTIASDITVYDLEGKYLVSTAPDLMRRISGGFRMDYEAYRQVVSLHKRYYIRKMSAGRRSFYNMYAPITDENGSLIAVLSSPYLGGESYQYERDALMHEALVVIVFLIMLMLSHIITTGMVDKLFKPILEITRKMSRAELGAMDYLEYDRVDELSSLVLAYNRMVTDLSESTRQLAQAERDKAWSGMARQVAHEIKNPLTPMKLQIQRIMRLKAKGDPQWQEKFDEASKVLLDHIEMLSETANDFSTFAKLYTEEPSQINLDSLLQEEISMFDNRDGVTFEYMGFRDSTVSGPKPQLTRVFVNLINNAVQALEGMDSGIVRVSLRKSTEEGMFDIVVEDNGPGVSSDNVDKLFTPNFTTKTAGSGLGLAMSRSILERCGATINYSRSFTLGGACFTVRYPKDGVTA